MGNYATATARREALRLLEELAATGDLRAGESKELDRLRSLKAADDADIGETDAAYRGFAQGATLSASDEIGAAARAVMGGDYDTELESIRKSNETALAAFPDAYNNGRFAGRGASSVIPFGGVARLTRGAGLLANTAASAMTGAGIAALDDFNAGEGGAEARAGNIDLYNAGAGAAAGAVAPIAGRAAGRLLSEARGPSTRNMSRLGYDPKAATISTRALGDDAALSDDVSGYLKGLGPEGMVADAGQNTRNLAAGIVMSPGQGGERLARAVNERNAGTAARVNADIDSIGGSVVDQEVARLARKAERTAEASPLYDAAKRYVTPLRGGDARDLIEDLIERQAPGARSLARYRNVLEGDVSAEVMHNIRAEIDGLARSAWQRNASHGETFKQVVRELDSQLDTVPGYAKARNMWADSKALDEASERGEKFLREDPDRLRAWFGGLSEPEQEAYRSAARRSLDFQLGKAVNEDTAARSLFKKRTVRDNVDMIFGEGSADRLAARTDTEATFATTRNKLVLATDTAGKQAAQREIAPLVDEAGNRLGPVKRAKLAAEGPINRVVDSILRKPKGKAMADIGRIMAAQGEERDQIVSALLRDLQAQRARDQISKKNQAILQSLIAAGATSLVAN